MENLISGVKGVFAEQGLRLGEGFMGGDTHYQFFAVFPDCIPRNS
jgi:hypothetical protein